ncbi:MAG: PIN domain-containing protein [Dehalococcoidia bacterium]|nr:PIN domain-containing protein [Dehalococcoidia bacterium]
MTPVFVDTNIPMYAVGAPHPLRAPSVSVLELVAERPSAFITSVEVLQEIVHRYLSEQRWTFGREVLSAFRELFLGRVEAVTDADMVYASGLADEARGTRANARDLLHAAVMHRAGSTRIISADRGFDDINGVTRLDPTRFEEWATSLV